MLSRGCSGCQEDRCSLEAGIGPISRSKDDKTTALNVRVIKEEGEEIHVMRATECEMAIG